MKQKIPSESVASKMNEWYSMIRRNNVTEAEFLKAEIQKDIEEMEEDQTVIEYYLLIDFRHKIMLKDLKPHQARDIKDSLFIVEKNKEKIQQRSQVDEMINYYFWFFKGMYEFKQKNFNIAITYYRIAEQTLSVVTDEIERAEFYYKMAEIYYHLNQNYLSMNYITMAFDTFKAYETLIEKKIFCYFVMAGNKMDCMRHEEALEPFQKALSEAKKTQSKYLLSSALFNVGNCYFYLNKFSEAYEYIERSLKIFEEEEYAYIPKAIFQLMYVCIKQKNYSEALSLYKKGIEYTHSLEDKQHEAQLNILKGVYLEESNHNIVDEGFDYLESKHLYADVEELAIDAASYYNGIGMLEKSAKLYQKGILARTQIRRGDVVHEKK
ncbi:tetratricopeptide repeat protein [Bacillus sp. WMMC1349]|uniref:Rap family tetratricopeptide repeat protein n=1 Tax=Bacillus sp. WMMC1349 TaxID=2736254 RepID=UPI0015580201|nr:Rap family tetratricopeptide repeat protein [Bacillus sp. WMMC1349]NPC92876.1 tetratricopeptide repeat protein [Bacillus sp. WMMC1349]